MILRDNDFVHFVEVIKIKYGLNLYSKKSLVQSRLVNYILDCGFDNFSEYFNYLYSDSTGTEMTNVINRLTTNYTYFMRESEHFEHFNDVFLAEASKYKLNKELCIWSAGCSFGNEPYNLAMCMEEFFGFFSPQWDSRILATDVSSSALYMAKRGIFSEKVMETVPLDWREKYFKRLPNGTYQVTEKIRNNVIFKYHNLMDPITFKKKFDLIVCRNVMIYFDNETKKELVNRFYDATAEGGYLYIGHAESIPENVKYEKVAPSIYRKTKKGEKTI